MNDLCTCGHLKDSHEMTLSDVFIGPCVICSCSGYEPSGAVYRKANPPKHHPFCGLIMRGSACTCRPDQSPKAAA